MIQLDTLVCVYTCNEDRPLLGAFHRSRIGECLRARQGTMILNIYADPSVAASFHTGEEMMLRTPERYGSLSLKTVAMISYAVRHFAFRRLLKIDVTCVRTDFSGPQYAGRRPLDLERLEQFIISADPAKTYDGFILHESATRDNAENWASKKGARIDFQRIFGDGPMPPFYSGKCYFIGRSFAEYIAAAGEAVAEEHVMYMLGSEDTMIGRLYQSFIKSGGCPSIAAAPLSDTTSV